MSGGTFLRRSNRVVRYSGAATAIGLNAVGSAIAGYLGTVTVAAMVAGRTAGRSEASPDRSDTHRFAILVPAHNEAAGIADTLASLQRLDYPHECFSVHVVADNCTDETAAVGRRHGVAVHERTDAESPGKGPALNWLMDRLRSSDVAVDSVVIVDADSSLEPGFLRAAAEAMESGASAAQAFYGVRDIATSTSASLRFAALACRHHLRPLGRKQLGGSSGLYGNGMVFDERLLRGRQWSGHLTEDMEFQMELLLDGIPVVYVPSARLSAEMPDSLDAATTQNERWELGRLQIVRRFGGPLLRRVWSGGGAGRAASADSLADLLIPPLSVVVALQSAALAGAAVRTIVGSRSGRVNLLVACGASLTVVGHVVVGLRSVDAPASVYRSLLSAPRFVVWKVGLWVRVLVRPERVTWTRTARNSRAL